MKTSVVCRLVMTLRTPRRRISPRTKLRYRAIREFFRRALGSTSQQDIQINSSIAVNVTDLKRKIVGLEQQLDEVSKHCRDIACLDNCSRRESDSLYQSEDKHDIGPIKEQTETSYERKSNGIETQLIFKSECDYKKSEESDYMPKVHDDSKEDNVKNNKTTMNLYDGHVTKVKNKKTKLHKVSNTSTKLHKHKTRSTYDNVATVYSTSSFHSLTNNRITQPDVVYPSHSNDSKQLRDEVYIEEIIPHHHKDKKYKDNMKKNMGDYIKNVYEDKPIRSRKNKRQTRDLDPDFIADIIRRQYKPIKMFGRKESDLSQFSAPVCRDQEFSLQENIQEDPDLCSCFYSGRHRRTKPRCQDLNGMQSVCDARLYSSKKQLRHKLRRMHIDAYSNSDMYDLVPVKERTSPKTRRKFVESNRFPYEYYREVPPSPRTLRPRLNLKAQYYTELEDYMAYNKHLRKHSPKRQKRYQECLEQFESDMLSEVAPVNSDRNIPQQRLTQKYIKVPVEDKHVQEKGQQDNGTMSSLQYPQYANEQTSMTIDTSLNKTQETEINVDKTDKALCEIKDILQTFLHEIKKDTVASQCDKSDITHDCKTQDNESNLLQDPNAKLNSNILPNSASFNNYSVGQCGMAPYIAPFTNPCCYPVMPICPMNCPLPVPNGYLVQSQSYTCTNCANAPKETSSAHCCNKNIDTSCPTDTDELIKEIYKFVARSPTRKNNNDRTNKDINHEIKHVDSKIMTSRSAGGSCKYFQQDANVGTQPLKCYSKSCEALGSRMISDPYYSGTNASYSDTLLEKLSLEATTQSISETELDTETTDPDKAKRGNKFSKVLRSIGIFKKKKKDVIEELSESESVDVEVKPKKPPFRQEVANYMMHGQEYYRPPPIDPLYQRPHEYPPRPHEYQQRSPKLQQRSPGFQRRHHEYQQRPLEYPSRSHEYPQRLPEYQPRPHEYQPEYHPPYNPGVRGYPSPQLQDPYGQRYQSRMPEHQSAPPHPSKQRPTAPPFNSSYDSNYSQMQPPLCLKEIEVKSTGTQSERKMSLFKKLSKKMQPPVRPIAMAAGDDYQRTFSTQTPNAPPLATKPALNNMTKPLFNWKSLQSKAMQGTMNLQTTDPMTYSLKTQKELAAGDMKLRNAMLKKLFYKRNPFSPRNLVVRTLLGKDKSSYGDPPQMYRPRMFI